MTLFQPRISFVANGVSPEGKLKGTLLISPVVSKAKKAIDLKNWPSEVAKIFSSKKFITQVLLAKAVANPITVDGTQCHTMPSPENAVPFPAIAIYHRKLKVSNWQDIDKAWQSQILGAAVNGDSPTEIWDELAKLLALTSQQEQFTPALSSETSTTPSLGVNGEILGSVDSDEKTANIKTVLSVRHGALANQLQKARGKAVNDLLETGRDVPADLIRTTASDEDAPIVQNAQKIKDKTAEAALKKNRKLAFENTVKRTKTERRKAEIYFNNVKNALNANTCESLADIKLPNGQEKEDLLAAHEYGTHPQSSMDFRKPTDGRSSEVVRKISKTELRDALGSIYFSIESSPVLSRVFNFAVDVEIEDQEELASFTAGQETVMFLASTLQSVPTLYTSAKLVNGDQSSQPRFLPATRAEMIESVVGSVSTPMALLSQKNGVSLLSTPMPGTPDTTRYQVSMLDVRHALEQDRPDIDDFKSDEVIPVKDREARYKTAGLTLSDCAKNLEVLEELAIASAEVAKHKKNAKAPVCLFAEDLTVGQVVDVAIATSDTTNEWRCLMERLVFFNGLDNPVLYAVGGGSKDGDEQVLRRTELERGLLTAHAREIPRKKVVAADEPNDKSKDVDVVVEETVAVWNGEPMGFDPNVEAPSVKQEAFSGGLKKFDLPIQRDTHEPQYVEGIKRIPPLRFGKKYRIGLRSVFAGGGSLTLEQASQIYDAKNSLAALPKQGVEALTFRRNESLLTPHILMSQETALAASKPLRPMPYENSTEMIVRTRIEADDREPLFKTSKTVDPYISIDRRAKPDETIRFLLPPSISMSEGYLHGLFDDADLGEQIWKSGSLPQLAFKNGFPEAKEEMARGFNNNEIIKNRLAPEYLPQDAESKIQNSGVALFKLQEPLEPALIEKPDGAFYADPTAHKMIFALRRVGADAYDEKATGGKPFIFEVDLYPKSKKWANGNIHPSDYLKLMPVELIVRKARSENEPLYDRQPGKVYKENGQSITVTKVTVALPKGEHYQVDFWCAPRREAIENLFTLPQYMCEGDQSHSSVTIAEKSKRLWNHITTKGPIEQLAAAATVSAKHAVNRPLSNPSFVDISAVKVERTSMDKPKHYRINAEVKIDLLTCDSLELVAQVAFPSDTSFDLASRGRSRAKRRAGKWPKTLNKKGKPTDANTRTVFGFKVDETGRTKLPLSTVSLLRTDQLGFGSGDDPDQGVLELQDLFNAALKKSTGKKDDGNKASSLDPKIGKVVLQHRFPDAKARKLRLTLLGIGRYASDFTTTRYFRDEADGLLRSKYRLVRKNQALSANDQVTVSEDTVEVWMPSAIKPEACLPLAPEPSFVIERHKRVTADTNQINHYIERRVPIRIRLRRPWFSSGEGERVGIVVGKEIDRLSWEKQPRKYITVWGADPVHVDEAMSSPHIPRENFNEKSSIHDPKWVSDVKIPVPNQDDFDDNKSVFVADLLTLVPHFDVDREEWYVDLDLQGAKVAQPFAQISLVRYQEHSLNDDLSVSDPVTIQSLVMPTRNLEASATKALDGWKVSAKIDGNVGKSKILRDAAVKLGLDRTKMRMTLFHERLETAPDNSEVKTFRTLIDPKNPAVEIGWRPPNDTTPRWELSMDVPLERLKELGRGRLCAFVEEIESYHVASYPIEPVVDSEELDEMIDSGARFSAKIVFDEIDTISDELPKKS